MIKKVLFDLISQYHFTFADKGLPSKLGIYFHDFESHQHAALSECIDYLRSIGYRFCGLDEYLTAQDKVAYISFDDNYLNWYESLPLLEQLDVKATFYTNTLPFADKADETTIQQYYDRIAFNGKRIPLTTEQLKAIHDAGHIIACHTHSHANLGGIDHDEAIKEIEVSKQNLEQIIDAPVEHFSYPFGMRRNFTDRLRQDCSRLGIKSIASAVPAMLHIEQTPYTLQRTAWHLDEDLEFNLRRLRIDGHLFENLTGRSALG